MKLVPSTRITLMKIGKTKKTIYLDVVFVESLSHRICEKVIFRTYGLSLTPCPFYILFLATHVLIVIHQTQNQLHPVFSCFGYCKIQSLLFSIQEKELTNGKHRTKSCLILLENLKLITNEFICTSRRKKNPKTHEI